MNRGGENSGGDVEPRSLISQLRERVAEAEGAAADLNSLLASISVVVVVVDRDLVLRRITPATDNLFGLLASDIGSRLQEMSFAQNDGPLLADVRRVFKTVGRASARSPTAPGAFICGVQSSIDPGAILSTK